MKKIRELFPMDDRTKFIVSIAATTIAKIMLAACSNTFLEVVLLQTLNEGGSHNGRKIGIFAV